MKTLLAVLCLSVAMAAQAQPRTYSQAELDALLAPVALYPDALLSDVLAAATYPDDVADAAAWLRSNPHLKGDEAVRAAEPLPWHPSLKALLAYPDLLQRMAESPQWTEDLGDAFLAQEAHVMATVQALRARAQASGYGASIVVQPIQSGVVYLPYYSPLVVYGPWWSHSHRPVAWRPWHPRPLIHKPHRPRPVEIRRPKYVKPEVTIHNHFHQAQKARPIVQGARIVPDRPRIEPTRRPAPPRRDERRSHPRSRHR